MILTSEELNDTNLRKPNDTTSEETQWHKPLRKLSDTTSEETQWH